MTLTLRQKALIHIVVQRFDRETQTTRLEAGPLAAELMADPADLATDIDVLMAEGYVERVGDADEAAGDETIQDGTGRGGSAAAREGRIWLLNPTDKAVMSAMGLE
jgi:hypothetical protein